MLSNANIPTFLNASDLMFNFVLGLKIELSFLGKMASSFLVKIIKCDYWVASKISLMSDHIYISLKGLCHGSPVHFI